MDTYPESYIIKYTSIQRTIPRVIDHQVYKYTNKNAETGLIWASVQPEYDSAAKIPEQMLPSSSLLLSGLEVSDTKVYAP
jgi:hypothetical protein